MVFSQFHKPGRVATLNEMPSRTQQHFGNECNINQIMAKVKRGQQVPTNGQEGSYGDFSNVGSYQDALMAVEQANQSFMALPASTRAYFKNDPGLLLQAMQNPQNKEKLEELGILIKKEVPPEPKPQKVVIVEDENTPKKAKKDN